MYWWVRGDEYGMHCCVTCHDGGEWHTVTTFYICGWTTVVFNVLLHHGGWSWLSYLVQCCCQTISWLLLVWAGMEMVLYWCVPSWWYAVVSGDVAVVLMMFVALSSFLVMWRLIVMLSCGDIAVVMDECLLPCPLTSWCMWSDVVVDGTVLMCGHGLSRGGLGWCSCAVLSPLVMYLWWWVDCCDCWLRRENLITEELILLGSMVNERRKYRVWYVVWLASTSSLFFVH